MTNIVACLLLWPFLVFPTIQFVSSHTVHHVLDKVGWKTVLLICDTVVTDCLYHHTLAIRPAVYMSLNLRNSSAILCKPLTHMHLPDSTTCWCSALWNFIGGINSFEMTHGQHGYLTYRYQWILVPSEFTVYYMLDSLGTLRNLLLLDGHTTYTAICLEPNVICRK